MNEKKVLVLAPHCDDEVLGCGGVIAKYTQANVEVIVAVVTNGNMGAPEIFPKEGTEKVRKETRQAHDSLGVSETYFLDFPAPRLDSIASYRLASKIEEIIREHQITDLYIPHRGDIHKDHRITFETALVASRPINNNPVKRIYVYETLSETEWAPPFGDDAFIPTVFEDISSTVDQKIEAFQKFTTQIKTPPHPRSVEMIRNQAALRGSTVSMEYAEAFMLIREIRE